MTTVTHEARWGRFIIRLPEGDAALVYAPAGAGVVDFRSTWVPPEARGRGIGGVLVEAALTHARERGLRVIPSCWFVRDWIAAHPEYSELLAD